MLKMFSGVLLLVLNCLTVQLAAAELDTAASRIEFSGSQMGREFTGLAHTYSATAEFDGQQLRQLSLSIQADSLLTENAERDQLLHGDEWLDAQQFRAITFTGESVDGVRIQGFLTIRDTRLPLTLDLVTRATDAGKSVSASGVINRLEYGLGSGEWLDTAVVGATVKFSATLAFSAGS